MKQTKSWVPKATSSSLSHSDILIYLLLGFQRAIAFVLPVGNALRVAVSIGHAAIHSSVLVPILGPEEMYQPTQQEHYQSASSSNNKNHIQEEVLVRGHFVYSWAQVVSSVVTEDVADPVHSPGDWVTWLIFVDVGEETSLLAVPGDRKTAGMKDKKKHGEHPQRTPTICRYFIPCLQIAF